MSQSLHSFRGNTLEEAYRRMRGALGEHALVVRTTEVRRDGLWGLLGGREIEVTASAPPAYRAVAAPERPVRAANPAGPATRAKIAQFEQLVRSTQERTGIDASMRGREIPPGPPFSKGGTRAGGESFPGQPFSKGGMHAGEESAPGQPFSMEGAAAREETRAGSPLSVGGMHGREESPVGRSPSEGGRAGAEPGRVVHGSLAPKLQPMTRGEDETAVLRREVAQMRDMLSVLLAEKPGSGLPPEFAGHYRTLVESGVARAIAARLIAAVGEGVEEGLLRNERVVAERLKLLLGKELSATGGLRLGATRAVVALVGPTGVGKTTNIAKIAAQFSVRQGKRVALITTDTYRIAAPEQLRVYANIIGLPMSVVNDARDMRQAMADYADYDLVLMDTAGSSQFNAKQINELRLMMTAARPNEVLLVASANTPLEDLRSTVSSFAALQPTALLFSKLDETQRFGHLYTIAVESGLPLAYFSDGQDVPDDLLEADTGALAALVLKGIVDRG